MLSDDEQEVTKRGVRLDRYRKPEIHHRPPLQSALPIAAQLSTVILISIIA